MNGILVVNHFLQNEKFDTLHNHLIHSAEKMGIDLKLKTNLELATQSAEGDFVLFWDKDINLARRLELEGMPVFNSARSIELCDDKAKTYLELLGTVNQPETLIAPKCFFKSDMIEFIMNAVDILSLPLVFKECFGSFGAQVYLCKTVDDILSHISEKPFILQKFISESAGCDIRLEIIDGKCVSAVKRENKNDFRSNVTNGGTMTPYEPTDTEVQTAIDTCNRLGLTFGGVDMLLNGLVCEVNSNAHIINIMHSTGTDIAPLIFDAVLRKIV